MVVPEPGLPVQDMQPGGLVSGTDVRAFATRGARYRLHQQRFKLDVMRAYRQLCNLHAARAGARPGRPHRADSEQEGVAAVVNGLALCAIHHLALDRNLLGIDPDDVVHIADRLHGASSCDSSASRRQLHDLPLLLEQSQVLVIGEDPTAAATCHFAQDVRRFKSC